MNRIGGLVKRYRLFLSILLSGTLVTGITVAMISTLASAYYNNALKSEVIRWKSAEIADFQHSADTFFEQLRTSGVSFLQSSAVSDYEEPFYTNMFTQSKYRPDERQILNRGRLAMALAGFGMSNPLIHSAYFYDRALEQVVAVDGVGYTLDRFHDKDILQFTTREQNYPIELTLRPLAQKSTGYPKSVVTMTFRTFKTKNTFIVNLDASLLNEKLLKGHGSNQKSVIFCRADGTVLLGGTDSRQGEHCPMIDSVLEHAGGPSAYFEAGDSICFFSYSELLDGYFIETGSLNGFMQQRSSRGISVNAGIVMIGLLGVCLFVGLSWLVYRPLHLFVRQLSGGATNRSELENISGAYTSVRDQCSEMEAQIKRNSPLIRSALLQSMIFGNRIEAARALSRMEEAGFPIPRGKIHVAVLQPRPGQKNLTVEEEYALLQASMQIMEEHLCPIHGLLAQTGEHLVFAAGCGRDILCSEIEKLSVWLARQHRVILTAGVSSEHESIREIGQAYRQGCDTLRYQIVLGEGLVICADDMKLDDRQGCGYPYELESELLEQIMLRNVSGAEDIAERVIERITSRDNELSIAQIRQYLLILFGAILKQLSAMGAEIGDILTDDGVLPDRLLYSVDRKDVSDMFKSLIGRIDRQVAYQQGRKNAHLMQVVTEYIDANYQYGISLEEVAEHVRLSPTYLGRLIKMEKGCGFTHYLSHLRIRRARELLRDTAMKVEDIGASVGYPNANYFIRVFKEKTGCTPGEYRARFAGGGPGLTGGGASARPPDPRRQSFLGSTAGS